MPTLQLPFTNSLEQPGLSCSRFSEHPQRGQDGVRLPIRSGYLPAQSHGLQNNVRRSLGGDFIQASQRLLELLHARLSLRALQPEKEICGRFFSRLEHDIASFLAPPAGPRPPRVGVVRWG